MLALYKSLGWRQHLYPERVARALAASTCVVTAWDGDRLVGMARIDAFYERFGFHPVSCATALTRHGPH